MFEKTENAHQERNQDLIWILNTEEKLQHIQLLEKQSLSKRKKKRQLRRSKAQRNRLVKVSPRAAGRLIVTLAARGWLTWMIGMQRGQCRPLKNLSLKAFIIQNDRTRQRKRHRTSTRWDISCYEKRKKEAVWRTTQNTHSVIKGGRPDLALYEINNQYNTHTHIDQYVLVYISSSRINPGAFSGTL